ncbi:MAG: ABC transporter substrate-binding protein [Alphaproteobacteria bacterium]|nr:MAG: ABC transporter substrate-binding protein [Alphaproteobacteria bacterium]
MGIAEQAAAARAALGAALIAALPLIGAAPAAAEDAGEKIITSHGISAFGDLKYPADFKHFDFVNPDAPKGGTFSSRGTGASVTFDSLNPFILKGVPAQGLGLMYDSLLSGSPDEPDAAYGYIARSITYPESRQWVIFDLRPEARFQDGVPITAEDVVWTFNTLMTKGHPAYRILYKDVEKVEALGPHRVKFTFRKGVNTRDLPMTVGGMSILPKHYWEAEGRDFTATTLEPPVGSGEYRPVEVDPGRRIKYCRIPDYWAKDLPAHVGTMNFDCYTFEYFADTTAAFEAFKAGAYLFHEEFFSKLWATAYDFPALRKGWVKREVLPDGRPSGTQGFWINLRREKFRDIRTRKALDYLFNFEWSNKTLFYGLYKRTDSFWENSDMQAEGLPGPEELALLEPFRDQLPPEVFTEPAYSPPVLRPVPADRAALRKASKLLDEAGWKIVNGKRVNDRGEVLRIEIVDDSPAFERIVNPFVENMRRVGIEASYRLVDPAQMEERRKNYDYDILIARLVMSLTPGEELLSIFGSQSADVPDTSNFSGVKHPAVDALIRKIAAAKTREEMKTAVRALDRVLRALHIWVPNWYKGSHTIAYWDVFGRPPKKPPYARGVMPYWWWDEQKYRKLKAEGAPI